MLTLFVVSLQDSFYMMDDEFTSFLGYGKLWHTVRHKSILNIISVWHDLIEIWCLFSVDVKYHQSFNLRFTYKSNR